MLAPTSGIYTNALLTAVHREAITALLCAATLYHSKIWSRRLRFAQQYFIIYVHALLFSLAYTAAAAAQKAKQDYGLRMCWGVSSQVGERASHSSNN